MTNSAGGPEIRPACGDRNGPTPCILVEGHNLNHASIWRDQWALWRNERPGAYESEQARLWRTAWKASVDFQAAVDQLSRNQESTASGEGQSG